MKVNTYFRRIQKPRFIVNLGRAKLLLDHSNQVRVFGGSSSEIIEAKEWISLFMHESVLAQPRCFSDVN
jgi:hypothetical protein